MVDTDMYKGPILLIYGEEQQQVEQQVEKLVLTTVRKVGVNVDKDELLKTLAYDRGQYEKGRADALASIVRCAVCKQWDVEQGRMGRGWCGVRMCMTRPEWYCWDGDREEALEDEAMEDERRVQTDPEAPQE